MLDRAEVWADWPELGGTPLGCIDAIDPTITWRIGGQGGGTFRLAKGDATGDADQQAVAAAYALVRPGRIVRFVEASGLWRNVRVLDMRGDGPTVTVTCGTYYAHLKKSPPITLPGTVPTFTFDGVGLTAEEHLTHYCKPQWDAMGLTFLELGTIVSTKRIDIAYSNDTVASAVDKIAAAIECEPSFRPDLSTGLVYLDMLPNTGEQIVGSGYVMTDGVADLSDGLPIPDADFGDLLTVEGPILEVGRNAAITTTLSEVEQVTQVFGAGEAGVTIAEAMWVVSAKDTNAITLADLAGGAGPIGFDDQLNGLYLEADDRTTRTLISDSVVETQVVTVADGSAFSVGERVRLRTTADGGKLVSLTDPASVALYGELSGVVSRPDIPETVNLVPNADQSTWTGGSSAAADSWAAVGTPTLTRTTDAQHRELGPYSCKVEATSDAHGYASPVATLKLSAGNPYVSGVIRFKLVTGKVRVELVATDGVDTWVFPDGVSQKAVTTAVGTFVSVMVAGIALPNATAARIRVVQDGPAAATWYVDAAQITESAGALPLVIGAGPTQLHQAINVHLALFGPVRARYEGRAIDFARLDPVGHGWQRLIPGVLHTVKDETLGLLEGVRLLEIEESLVNEADTRITLSSLPGDLKSLRQRVARPRLHSAAQVAQIVAAHPNARFLGDFVTTSSSTEGTSASADFTAADEGATLWVIGAGSAGATLKTTVSTVDDEATATMADAASATLTDALAILGTSEGVLTLAGTLGSSSGANPNDGDGIAQAAIDAAIRELARRIAELDTQVGEIGVGEPGPEGPPGNSYEPMTVVVEDYAEPGTVWPMSIDAPALGVLLDVTSVPPAQIDILGYSGATTPELAIAETGGKAIIPGAIIANRDATMIDRWYLNVTPTEDPWDGVASTNFLVPIEGTWGTAPLIDSPFAFPGPLTGAAWYCASASDYFYTQYRIGLFGAGSGAGGDSAYPMLVNQSMPEAATEIAVWLEVFITMDGTDAHSASVVLSANGNGHLRQIEARITFQWDGDSTSTFTLELAYTNNAGTRTVLDTDVSTTIPISGNGSFGLRLECTRNAEDNYDLVAYFARASQITVSGGGPDTMVVDTPDLTVSVTGQTVDSVDHKWTGFRLIDCDEIEPENPPYIAPDQFGLEFTTDAAEGDYRFTARVMPLYWVVPPEDEEP